MTKKKATGLWEKIDVKITGYISLAILIISVFTFLYVVSLATAAAGTLPIWAAYVGFGIIVADSLAIALARWGQAQTGRKLAPNRWAVRLCGVMIGLMLLIYIWGIILSI